VSTLEVKPKPKIPFVVATKVTGGSLVTVEEAASVAAEVSDTEDLKDDLEETAPPPVAVEVSVTETEMVTPDVFFLAKK
jgi:hypothetical protein